MVKLLRFFAYVAFFVLSLMYFFPKIALYYFAETQLKKYDVVLSNEELKDKGFYLSITHPTISMKSIDAAKVSSIDIKVFALYNSVSAKDIYLSSMAASFVPLKIQKADVVYSVIDPTNINAMAYGEFGEINAKVDLLKRKVRAVLTPSKLMLKKYRNTLRRFKKQKNGSYLYEKNI